MIFPSIPKPIPLLKLKYQPTQKVIVIRHGTTDFNGDNKIRGWLDMPLSDKGIAEAKEMGNKLKENPPDCIITSDLDRAETTANIISEITNSPIDDVTDILRPWDLGEFTGQDVKETFPKIVDYAMNKPDENIPDGESFNSFKERFLSGLQSILEDYDGQRIAIVTHHRGDRLIDAWIKNGQPDDFNIDKNVFLQRGIDPGTFIVQTFRK